LVQTPLGPEGCPPIAVLHFIKNISESENYQSMILKLDRIASKGKMARDIAHEINNYLAILQGNLELLPLVIAKGDEVKTEQKLSLMRDTVAKISNFTDGLTKFSDENSEFEKEDLNQLVENLIAFIKPQNRFDEILIGTNLAENIPLVEIDAGQFQHLLLNLIYNAADSLATFEGTRWLIISTSLDDSGEAVYIKVSDSGPGVDPDNIQKLFVTRFSTRRQGNGLGLITCKNMVDNHRGEISYHTSDESQAIFQVRIPVKHPASIEPSQAGTPSRPEEAVAG
jgi:signal transduction histidine kinase